MIVNKTKQYFANFPALKILFLFDEAQEFLEEVQQIESQEFKVVYWENNPFVLKYQLTQELQDEKVLLYLPLPQPTSQEMYQNFPLMGLLLANKELQLDNVGAFMEEFGLQRHQKSMVSKYMSELKYASVKEVVTPILTSGNFEETTLQQGLLSAFLKFKNVENWVVIITKLCILSQEKNEAAFKRVQQKIKTTYLQEIITDKVKQHIGYTLKEITTEEFLQAARSVLYNYTMQNTRLVKNDAYATLKITDTSQITAINQFWQVVESHPLVNNGFQELLGSIQKDIQGKQLVATYGLEADYAFYPNNLTWAILEQLQNKIITNDEIGLKILEKLALQQELQGAAKETVRFLIQVLKTTLAINKITTYNLNTPEEYIANYTNKDYKIDTNYRRAILYLNEIDSVEVPEIINLEVLKNHLNDTYNKHVDQLNRQWLQCLSSIDFNYKNIQTPKQYDFYNTEVADVNQKLVVIISDALRYEVGAELLSKMHGDTKNTAEIRHVLASIPSKTNVGMAQLLPGEKEFNEGAILSDGISTESTNRTKLLQNYKENAEAVKFETVKNAKQAENRALFKNDLVYIYHDVIDALGDKRVSEQRTFEAVRTAVAELARFIKLLHSSYNVTNVLVTADHGFLYTDKKIEDKELESLPKDTLISHNRFFITKEQHENELGYSFPLKQTTAFKDDVFVNIPFSVNRYRKSGVGHQFVHCGGSLQELITPLIISSRKREEFAKKVNPLLLNNKKLRVTSNILKFNILQENEVSRLEKERTISVALYKETKLVSNAVEIVLNSTSEAPSDRLTNIELVLMAEFSTESIFKLKVFDTEDLLNPLIEELVTNNTLLGQDF
ncbi:BREX-1 system phosphatase PglZ type A [Polaribacter sp. Z014]|uniref:BREX-1 system phosphatase PglZ type A n=1 Tax=Polaribacter sp. Z014 TaxID=2927126 RepID=UPI00201FEADC|nr:BREX-1 system phosphatase PglZ type A [Polaribacter sp. Z014]MCL7762666.1 BREX-1 system phosphatase PglZ type A [Polaribacter sp. Z014]